MLCILAGVGIIKIINLRSFDHSRQLVRSAKNRVAATALQNYWEVLPMNKQKIILYTRDGCMQCKMTKRYLSEHQVDFQEINISENPASAAYLREKGFASVPLVFRQDQDAPIVGFRPEALQKLVG